MALHGATAAMRGSSSRGRYSRAVTDERARPDFIAALLYLPHKRSAFSSPAALSLAMLSRLVALARGVRGRHNNRGGPLERKIARRRKRLAACPGGHRRRAYACSSLAYSLCQLFEETRSPELLEEIITLNREALSLRPTGHPDRAGSCNNLAIALRNRYQVTGGSALLNEAITLLREALSLHPAGHPDRAMSCNNLANALRDRYEVTGISALLDDAIALYREDLSLRPAGHPDRAISCNNLANALRDRYDVTGVAALLDEAITLHREDLSLRSAGHPHRAMACNNLAKALWTRYEVTGVSALLDEAITLHREALSLRPDGHPDRASFCNNLANALHARYYATGVTALLDEAITLYREALSLQPAGHQDRASSCNNLASALSRRYKVTGVSALLDEAITLLREALALRPAGHPGRASACNNLADALDSRYRATGTTALLNEVTTLYREALSLTPAGHPYRASSCINLADQLLLYFQKTQDMTAIDEALILARESAASASPSFLWSPLITLCSIYMEQGSPHVSVMAATEYLSQASALHPDNITNFMRAMQDRLALIWSMQSTWTPDISLLLSHAYSNLIDGLSRMTGFVLDIPSQLTALKSARSFGSDACIAALLSNDPRQAMELVDHAHGVIWAQSLHQRHPQLQQLPQDLASELGTLLRAVSVPVIASGHQTSEQRVPGFLSPQDVRHEQNSRIQTLLTEIRAMPGLDRFMLGHTYAELRKTAKKHPVVVLVAARGQAYALIMPDSNVDSPHPLALAITSDRLSSLRDYAGRAGLRNGQSLHHMDDDARLGIFKPIKKDASMAVLSELWLYVVKPVLDYLQIKVRTSQSILALPYLTCFLQPAAGRSRPRLYWCPTGDFVCLPLHAAGIYHGPLTKQVCCADYVVSSYTPTLSALLRAQTMTPLTAPTRINMLVFGEDCSTSATMSTLHNIDREMAHIRAATQTSRASCTVETIASAATVDRVTNRIQSADFVHLACHGTQDMDNALESGFHLSDGKLTVSELMNLNLDKAWFAYLSACETAKGDEEQPDQVVHLAAAMLHAGFKSVVATMW
jgi:tetratricopeptide (TPR) repeat protein